MSETRSSGPEGIRRLPRGRHALPPSTVREEQRRRLIAAVPGVAAERGFAAMSVADLVRVAAVSRNAFYANFGNKQECFAAAVEAGYERVFAVLTESCDWGASLEDRFEARLGAVLALLASEPDLARLILIEAPAAGHEEALRQHRWLRRYAGLLRTAAPSADLDDGAEMIVTGGLASRIAAELLAHRSAELRQLTPNFVAFLLAVYGPAPTADRNGTLAGESGVSAPQGSEASSRPPRWVAGN
jgi:AcrR family transcriptional regulator